MSNKSNTSLLLKARKRHWGRAGVRHGYVKGGKCAFLGYWIQLWGPQHKGDMDLLELSPEEGHEDDPRSGAPRV